MISFIEKIKLRRIRSGSNKITHIRKSDQSRCARYVESSVCFEVKCFLKLKINGKIDIHFYCDNCSFRK